MTNKQVSRGFLTLLGGMALCAVAISLLAAPPSKLRIIQTNSAGDNIHIIDPVTNKVVGEIKGIEAPHGITVSKDGSRIYVSVESMEKVLDVVRELLGEVQIEKLPIPYTAVTTDLISGKSLWLQRGPLDAAIRASIAIPGMIAPYIADGRVLTDGGILDPLPVGPLAGANADVTIAVSLSGGDSDGTRYRPADSEPNAAAEWFNRLVRSTSALLETPTARSVLSRLGAADDDVVEGVSAESELNGDDEVTVAAMAPKLGSFEVMNRAFDVMQAALARHQLAAYPPDILIEVPRSSSRSLDFHRAADMIDLGRVLAEQALDSYEAQYRSDGE